MASECDVVAPKSNNSWVWGIFNWTTKSPIMLRNAEKRIFSYLKNAYRGWFVDIGPVVGEADKIWTISLNSDSPKTPLVLLHGFGAGVGLWILNLDSFAENRPVYAIDILGFGRSSRPKFACDAMKAEGQLVASIEEWRREMKLNEMILLGHSMGGFLAASYAISHPDRVKHLILADPWGFPDKPADYGSKYNIPVWVRVLAFAMQPLNPLWAVRAAGPFGQWVVSKARPDIIRKYTTVVKEEELIPQYIHQCNAQTPAGESAFHSMMSGFGWAKHPMIHRMKDLDKDVPITMMYGSRSWVDRASGDSIKLSRIHSYVNIQVINGAGHHIYADRPEVFNRYVNDVCALSDGQKASGESIDNSTCEVTTTTTEEIATIATDAAAEKDAPVIETK
ncbi:(Lyso)-N-acylphosphatidylethanolamine lipase isoform X1 [Lutzomyia longipalpis]|uniref:(Lyso)-N-acylphosphatidylethanolamine lipase isoform X1 n=2 Tax=Lutzomyia longipalpis TaxID=7200 RepID=UPI002484425A|nr:(Lyso)-N-acylphosphatidylethanolamine lipase isoform X1 [Lutzomyia longipalpis]